ncbi:hypothetical protein QFZ75_007958 [Streptomyces sp. V3I8]|uniref:DUF7236 family protein n=1 Tax=Streptomyces sp. V3I8 TaxID=3042279 RepID=UPI00277D38BE|nr:hypothetical protein [Streptomyces sp. V3I8]MDQ1041456.1 hypothetical protein [Streptomyces sp. V3I8]
MSRVRHGVDLELETAADELLKQSFLDDPDPDEKALILTKYMLQNRYKREVYTTDGTPDGSVRRGTFHRALNPKYLHLNAIEGVAAPQHRIPRTAMDE